MTWSSATTINGSFIRDVQVTGALPTPPPPQARYYSAVFVASMDEGGGGLTTRQNVIYRSLDGGVTWSSSITGRALTRRVMESALPTATSPICIPSGGTWAGVNQE